MINEDKESDIDDETDLWILLYTVEYGKIVVKQFSILWILTSIV